MWSAIISASLSDNKEDFVMFSRVLKPSTTYNSNLSEFVRNAKSREKKRVYARVIDKAIEAQNEVIERQKATS